MTPMKTAASVLALTTTLLCGCGGQQVSATVGGNVVGLSGGTQLLLENNGTDEISITSSGAFNFDQQINAGSTYNVTVVSPQPIGETCTVTNGTGTIDGNGDAITGILITCNYAASVAANSKSTRPLTTI